MKTHALNLSKVFLTLIMFVFLTVFPIRSVYAGQSQLVMYESENSHTADRQPASDKDEYSRTPQETGEKSGILLSSSALFCAGTGGLAAYLFKKRDKYN